MESLVVWDEFNQSHRIEEGEPLWNDARAAYDAASATQTESPNGSTPKIIWPLSKIATNA